MGSLPNFTTLIGKTIVITLSFFISNTILAQNENDSILTNTFQKIDAISISLIQSKLYFTIGKDFIGDTAKILNELNKIQERADSIKTKDAYLKDYFKTYSLFHNTIKSSLTNNADKDSLISYFYKLEILIDLMKIYKNNFRNAVLVKKMDTNITSLNKNISEYFNKTDSLVSANDSLLSKRLQSADRKINNKIDSISYLYNYGPLFVGPSLYIESTFGFQFLYQIENETPGFNYRNFTYSAELLFYAKSSEIREYGFTLNTGYALLQKRNLIPQIGFVYLPNKLASDKTLASNSFTYNLGLLIRNRSWMTGFSWSPITGGGIKLLIGL